MKGHKNTDAAAVAHEHTEGGGTSSTPRLQEIQRTSTPRPDWSKCEGNRRPLGTLETAQSGLDSSSPLPQPLQMWWLEGRDRWHMLAEGKNSDQLVDVLLEEIGEGCSGRKDFFPVW